MGLDGGAMTIDQESAQLGYGPAKHDPQGLLMSQLARDTLAIVLAGGRGSRLGPLTDWRGEPPGAVCGEVLLLHFFLSKRVHSRGRRIGLLPPDKAQSLIPPPARGRD